MLSSSERSYNILALYHRPGLHIHRFATTYRVSFQARNNRAAQHLIITND